MAINSLQNVHYDFECESYISDKQESSNHINSQVIFFCSEDWRSQKCFHQFNIFADAAQLLLWLVKKFLMGILRMYDLFHWPIQKKENCRSKDIAYPRIFTFLQGPSSLAVIFHFDILCTKKDATIQRWVSNWPQKNDIW